MWPRFVWELNLTTILTFAAGAIAFYLGVMRQRDTLTDVQKAVEHWKLQFLALKAEHDVFKERVIEDYVRKKELDPVVQQIFDKIDQGNRDTVAAINKIYERMLDDAKHAPPPHPRR